MKNIYLKLRNKVILIFLAICITILEIVFLVLGIKYNKKNIDTYSYSIDKNTDYKIILKPNNFYTNPVLSKQDGYASKSIDNINLQFIYKFNANRKENVDYSYNIKANLVASEENKEKEILTREYNYYLEEEKIENLSEINIDKTINIDYEYFSELVKAYEREYGIPVNAILKVKFSISYYFPTFSNVEKQEDIIELDIPITNTTTSIQEVYDKKAQKNIILNKDNIKLNKYLIVALILIVTSVILLIVVIIKNILNKEKEEKYKNKIKNLFNNYSDIIVVSKNKPNIENLNIINVEKISDLINAAQQNNKNIIFYEKIRNIESELYVIDNNFVYLYDISYNVL